MLNKEGIDMELRILPMSQSDEFNDISTIEVQTEFFLKDLPSKKGKYLYKKSGLLSSRDDFVLFQYDNRIVALATLINIEVFETPEGVNKEYHGAFYFEPCSIAIFDPIIEEEIENIWPNYFKGYNQIKYNLPISEFSRLFKLLTFKHIQYYNTKI